MADILIRGMEMPKTCAICKIRSCNSYCPLNIEIKFFFDPSNTGFDFCTGRHSDCPLRELPGHGDLIDLSELQKFPIRLDHYDKEHGDEHFVYGIESLMEYAECLPVIIPADKEETE